MDERQAVEAVNIYIDYKHNPYEMLSRLHNLHWDTASSIKYILEYLEINKTDR